jgi:hypothetical protein
MHTDTIGTATGDTLNRVTHYQDGLVGSSLQNMVHTLLTVFDPMIDNDHIVFLFLKGYKNVSDG